MALRTITLTTLTALTALALAPAAAHAGFNPGENTLLISKSSTGDFGNGASSNPAISHDRRANRVIAFQSDATNLVVGGTNGTTSVYFVTRTGSFGIDTGEAYSASLPQLVSHGLGGQPANGRSYSPVVDGNFAANPSCIAFVSDATNLVPGDTNGKPDAFVYHLSNGQIERVSLNSRGQESNGTTYDVAVDGYCDRVAVTSDATNLALTSGSRDRSKVTKAPPAGTKQVYVRQLKGHNTSGAKLVGLTWLASASSKGSPGAGDSSQPWFALDINDLITFTSTAPNLVKGDTNGVADVFVRRMVKPVKTGRVSTTAAGGQANGPSSHPRLAATGQAVAFQTDATNLIPGDTDPQTDVVRATLRKAGASGARAAAAPVKYEPRVEQLGQVDAGRAGPADGPSTSPATTDTGDNVTFQTKVGDVRQFVSDNPFLDPNAYRARDQNSLSTIIVKTFGDENVYLVSRDSRGQNSAPLQTPSDQPAISARGNYYLFRSSDPFADRTFIQAMHPDWLSIIPTVRQFVATQPAFQQIYMHFLGPR